MKLNFPDSKIMLNFLETKQDFTQNNLYLKETKVLEIMAQTFGNCEMEVDSVKREIGVILNKRCCLMPVKYLEDTVEKLTVIPDGAEDAESELVGMIPFVDSD